MPSASSSVWMPRPRAAERLEHRVGDAADADLQRCAVGDALDDRGGDRAVALVGLDGRDLDERPVGVTLAQHLGGVDLVEAERARHPLVDLEEEDLPDQRGDVIGVGAEREVAGRSGGLAAATIGSVASSSSRGISEKWFGSARSRRPSRVRVAPDRK